jgi:hypothetical protein
MPGVWIINLRRGLYVGFGAKARQTHVVRSSGVGETFERLESKCVLLVCGNEAKEA